MHGQVEAASTHTADMLSQEPAGKVLQQTLIQDLSVPFTRVGIY